MNKEQKYTIFNATDGFFASPDQFTKEEADTFIKEFPKRYAQQGYYRTGGGININPNDVILEMYPVEESIFTDNPVELATKLAGKRVIADFGSHEEVYVDVQDETAYTAAAQKTFDHYYDYYYELITNE